MTPLVCATHFLVLERVFCFSTVFGILSIAAIPPQIASILFLSVPITKASLLYIPKCLITVKKTLFQEQGNGHILMASSQHIVSIVLLENHESLLLYSSKDSWVSSRIRMLIAFRAYLPIYLTLTLYY